MLTIAHISDIHCGSEFQRAIFETAVEEINALEPDVLVVSGDLTENGLLSQFRLAREMLDTIQCERRLICSGNHDYRSTGYLLFKRFFPSKPVVRFGNYVFATVSTARPERNDGEVGHRQVIWLERTLARYKRLTKIIIMHHHLIQVPDTGPDNIPVIDAGDTLRGILESKVNLVLAGHRHRPWRWHLQDTQIIHAGTLSSERFRGFFANSYNVVKVDGRRIDAKLKIVGGKTTTYDDVVKGRVRFPHIHYDESMNDSFEA
jgi:3',5'-cyclic AMP phosphodiesterase CpdA